MVIVRFSKIVLLITALLFGGFAFASQFAAVENPLVGNWKSDKYLTRQSIINEHRLSSEEKSRLMKRGDLGELTLIITEGDFQRTGTDSTPYRVQEVRSDMVILEIAGSGEETRRLYVKLEGDKIYFPSSEHAFFEVYTRE